ncbi:NtaA/DmoA family FMN-dependent monooxygenase [Mycolicibacterium tusciae]|uniref:NtaA/DmoA family FMN-dependent monooxygenase n=1 Tax=Mycolicibacterium tusciae TaxID=75922 RepID=UPI00024A2ED6|nr:NtaA/DmoA family FMN-dependent monooxygenase [Mycolicibacterium tusciae]
MSNSANRLALNLSIKAAGNHPAAWRHPSAELSNINSISGILSLAARADEAGVDALFLADKLAFANDGATVPMVYEPVTLLGAIAAVTRRIGLIGSISTTFSHPFTVARHTASLDHISGGRVGWNVVTSGAQKAAQNYGLNELPGHATRYQRADEFLEAVTALWESWGTDALVRDRKSGVFVNTDAVRPANHVGVNFSVAGPLNSPRPPQGWPVIVQAGGSDAGRELAARWADSVYTVADDIDVARSFYSDVKSRAARYGRPPEAIRIMTGFRVLVAKTADAAQQINTELAELADPRQVLRQLALITGVDLDVEDLDQPVPALPDPNESEGYRTHLQTLNSLVDSRRPASTRELAHQLDGGFGWDNRLVGDASDVADVFEEWLEAGATDGINLGSEILHGGVDAVFTELIPELERRGLRAPAAEQTHGTLRERYGLARRDRT